MEGHAGHREGKARDFARQRMLAAVEAAEKAFNEGSGIDASVAQWRKVAMEWAIVLGAL